MDRGAAEQYRQKLTTADEAVRQIQSGWRVFLGSGCAVPQSLLSALVRNAGRFHDLELIQLLAFGTAGYCTGDYAGRLRHNSFFISGQIREAVREGRADYTPIFLSEIPELIRSGQRGCQAALLQLSPPDRHGYCSMGINVDIQRAALDRAKLVIAEINPRMPRTFGETSVHLSRIDLVVESDLPILVSEAKEPDEVELQIGYHISRLVENGSCLQMGIGAIPGTVLKYLADKRDLGIHTEMFSESLLPLIEQGNITNRLKKVHPLKSVASFVIGSRALYDFVDGNPGVEFHPSDHVNDPRVISANDNVVSINSALQVDLTGQICADSIGYTFYSGIGGQVDFTRGAAMSRGGKPVIAIRSTAGELGVSRIVARIDDGTGVVTSRGDAHYVVSEYGIAYLHGKTIRERALALISIAHPDYRRDLLDFVKKKHYVYEDEQVWQQALDRYPRDYEESRSFKGVELLVRPLKAVDERLLQEFFYSLDPESVYNRFFGSKVRMAHREAAKLVCIDYDSRMALAVFEREEGVERMVAVARYAVNPRSGMAETAVVVNDGFRRLGVARHLMRRLEKYARGRGVEGFQAEILPANEAMLRYHRELGHSLVLSQESGNYHMEYRFEV
ncbi:MAG: GNAT family N-acetyltransferase [Geobacter sp.]|nr:MAG: GNAT family N-acetyltransferase [Geobacter sp.]